MLTLARIACAAVVALIAIAGGAQPRSEQGRAEPGQPTSTLTDAEQQWLREHPTLKLGVDPAWAPFEFIDSDGRYQGMAADYIDLLNDALGIKMSPVEGLTWAEVIQSAKRREVDVLPCVVETPPRREYLRFTDAYLDFPMVVVTRDDASFVSGLEDLSGERVGVVRGYASADLLRLNFPALEMIEFDTLDDGLETLSLGGVDAFVDNLATIVSGIKRSNITNVKIAARTPFSFKLSFGVRDDWPELVSILNKALASLSDEQSAAIRNRWIRIKFEHGVDLPYVARVALLSIAAVALVMIVVFIWNRRLVSEVARRTRAEHTLARRNRIHEQISDNRSLKSILESLVRMAESESPGMLGSVLLLDRQGKHLLHGAAPSLPDFYNEAIDGIEIGEGVGSCGHAVYSRTLTVAEDILTHPNWTAFRELVEQTPLRACWSQPIMSTSNTVLGSFALYYSEPRSPTDVELELIQELALQAAMAIQHFASADSLRKLSLAVEHSPNAVLITDRDAQIEYVNPQFSIITGYSPDEVYGSTPRLLQSGIDAESQREELWAALRAGEQWRGEVRNRRKSGALYWAYELIAPIVDSDGEITHFVWLQEDVTEVRENNAKISYQASHDALTGLLNRHEFERRLVHARRTVDEGDDEHALCFFDLDQFKVVNDTAGHVAGDELLRQLGSLLKENLRKQDSLARFGGDEFAVLMEYCSVEQARGKAEHLRQVIDEFRFSWDERMFSIGASVGIAPINAGAGTVSDVLRHADIACYAAKDAGRNRVHVYEADDALSRERSGEMEWANRISHALDNDGFTLFVQPMVSVHTPNAANAYEVLLRMVDTDGALLNPGAFLPAAERYQLATRIDRWVIDTLFRWLRKHAAELDPNVAFSINLSGQSMGDPELLGHLIEVFETGEVPSRAVQFEITETAAISNLSNANVFISALSERGIKFALDDFGSGLSSFGYLKNLHADYLKIDGMFVRDVLTDPIDAAMVKSINEIGHVMGKKTIAEFVEDTAILEALQSIGVDYAQGYGIGKPMPLEHLESQWADRRQAV